MATPLSFNATASVCYLGLTSRGRPNLTPLARGGDAVTALLVHEVALELGRRLPGVD